MTWTYIKACTKCGRELPLEEFAFKNKEKGTRHSWCKGCKNEYTVHHYNRNLDKYLAKAHNHKDKIRGFIRTLKEQNPCMDCKQYFPYYVMDFDHKGDKQFNVSRMFNLALNRVIAEIDKCDIVCANCHRVRTHNRL